MIADFFICSARQLVVCRLAARQLAVCARQHVSENLGKLRCQRKAAATSRRSGRLEPTRFASGGRLSSTLLAYLAYLSR